jgi:hypothetical protein
MYDVPEDESRLAGPSGQYNPLPIITQTPQEFGVDVEVYISKAATAHRKVRAMITLYGVQLPLTS